MSELILQPNFIREELDTQISTAKAYPRNTQKFLEEATTIATLDQETSESCIYSVPRGYKDGAQNFVKGESIRLAEIVANAWGNLHAAARIVENDGKSITVEAVAWDLEKNLKVGKQVKRSILNRDGKVYTQDMQVMAINAASSIALRNAILSVIPRALVKKVYAAAVKNAIGDQTKFPQRVKALFDRFAKLSIDKEKILFYFGRKSDLEITPEDVEEMIGIGTALKDKNLSIDKAFVIERESSTDTKANDLNNRLESKVNKGKNEDLATKPGAQTKDTDTAADIAKEFFNE